MDDLILFCGKAIMLIGMITLLLLFVELIVWAIKRVVRSITDIRYAAKVKFYLEDGHQRIAGYEERIKAIEKEVADRGESGER